MLNIIMSYWAVISSSRLHYTCHKPFTKLSRLLCTHVNYRYCSSHNGSDYLGVTLNWLQNRTGGLLNLIVYSMVQSFYVINYTMVMSVYKIGRSGWCMLARQVKTPRFDSWRKSEKDSAINEEILGFLVIYASEPCGHYYKKSPSNQTLHFSILQPSLTSHKKSPPPVGSHEHPKISPYAIITTLHQELTYNSTRSL